MEIFLLAPAFSMFWTDTFKFPDTFIYPPVLIGLCVTTGRMNDKVETLGNLRSAYIMVKTRMIYDSIPGRIQQEKAITSESEINDSTK
jgi:hypothetical protein